MLNVLEHPRRLVRVAGFELDPVSGELRHGENVVRLQPQPLKLLLALLRRPGELVTREELKRELMPDAAYGDFDHAINLAVSKLRAALNDSADSTQLIETLARRGYRFVGMVEAEGGASVGQIKQAVKPQSWLRRRATWAIIAVVVLVGGAAIYIYVRHRREQRVIALTEKDTIVLADVTNTTGDDVFTDTLRQALTVQLSQSPFLNILSDTQLRQTLRQMGRQPQDPVVGEVARELCIRTKSKVYVAGSIASVGKNYVVGLKAFNCATGEAIFQEQAEVSRKEEVLKMLGKQASVLRYGLGESLASVQKFDTPLEEATTSSLEALKSYSMGTKIWREQGDPPSIPFFKRAIELDPNFAMAYAWLAVHYNNLQEPSLALEYAAKAYQLRDRATERERLRISTAYFIDMRETDKEMQTYELWIANYPRDTAPHANLGVAYWHKGQYDKALVESQEALRLAPSVTQYSNLGQSYLFLNRLEEAKAVFDQALAHKLDGGVLRQNLYYLAFLRGDATQMEQQVAWAAGKPGVEDLLLSMQSDTEAYHGRLSKARDFSRRAVESAIRAEAKETAALWQANAGLWEAELGNAASARQGAKRALALSSGRDVKVFAALTLARAGDAPRARVLAEELERNYPTNSVLKLYWLPTIKAGIELNQGSSSLAIVVLEAAAPYDLGNPPPPLQLGTLYPPFLRGQAYLLAHNGTAAAAEFQKVLDHPGIVLNFATGSLAHLQIGRAYAMAGDTARAKAAYLDFLTLWEDSDPEIPIYKQAKAEYAKLQ